MIRKAKISLILEINNEAGGTTIGLNIDAPCGCDLAGLPQVIASRIEREIKMMLIERPAEQAVVDQPVEPAKRRGRPPKSKG